MKIERGCGFKTAGAIYAVIETAPWGRPIEYFLVDPVEPIDPAEHGLSAIGMKVFERAGRFHVLDWVGQSHYPNMSDYVEEIRRFGYSAKLNLSRDDLAKLQVGSFIFSVHATAYVENPEYWRNRRPMILRGQDWNYCPRGIPEHEPRFVLEQLSNNPDYVPPACVGLPYEDIVGGIVQPDAPSEYVVRKMPSFTYEGYRPADNSGITDYKPAIFLRLPLVRLVVVNDPIGKTHEENVEKLRGNALFNPDTDIIDE